MKIPYRRGKAAAQCAGVQSSSRGPGRPPGSKSRDYDQVATIRPRCLNCQSTRVAGDCRDHNQVVIESSGIAPDGQPYSHIVLYHRCCADCGQWRIERTYELRTGKGGSP